MSEGISQLPAEPTIHRLIGVEFPDLQFRLQRFDVSEHSLPFPEAKKALRFVLAFIVAYFCPDFLYKM